MSKKDSTPRVKITHRPIKIAPAATLSALLLTGCIATPEETPSDKGDLNPNPPSSSNIPENHEEKIIASSATSATSLGKDFRIDIYALENVGEDKLRLRLGATNKSESPFLLYSGLGIPDNPQKPSGITLIDTKNRKRHFNYEQSDGSCFCSPTEGNIASGETLEMWIIYPSPPENVDSMSITTPLTPPILDIPISESSETIENKGLSDPKIIDLVTITDDIGDQTGRTESSEEVSILLSSDVLFETNSAELNPESQEILQQVAQEIDNASSKSVKIDGHADNTGSDAVNLPLSEDRAQTVENSLSSLITRTGINFEVAGHGSNNPIATNETEEGRERNRRVSVTFKK